MSKLLVKVRVNIACIRFYFDKHQEGQLVDLFFNGIKSLRLVDPELLPGKLFDEIVFNIIENELFCHLLISRLYYSVSKLKTTDYLFKYQGLTIEDGIMCIKLGEGKPKEN